MDIPAFLSKILSTTWYFHPQELVAYGNFLKGLLEGSIIFEETKTPLAIIGSSPTGERIIMQQNNDDKNQDNAPESIFDQFPEGSVIIIPVKGVMFKEDTWWSWGTETIGALIREAADHKNIKAIIKDVHSGGGAVNAVAPMVDATLYAKTKKPVISISEMAASAAYYSVAADDLIIASNDISSAFGSIGVMISFWDIAPYWKKLGLKEHTIYANQSKHKNLPFENALKGDYKLIKKLVLDPLAIKFQSDVRKFRKGKVDITQKGILNGKMYYANDAIKYGLADELGNLEYAIKRANDLASKK